MVGICNLDLIFRKKYSLYFYELYVLNKNYPQLEDNLDEMIFMIPWGHQKLIIDKSVEEIEKKLSRN